MTGVTEATSWTVKPDVTETVSTEAGGTEAGSTEVVVTGACSTESCGIEAGSTGADRTDGDCNMLSLAGAEGAETAGVLNGVLYLRW